MTLPELDAALRKLRLRERQARIKAALTSFGASRP